MFVKSHDLKMFLQEINVPMSSGGQKIYDELVQMAYTANEDMVVQDLNQYVLCSAWDGEEDVRTLLTETGMYDVPEDKVDDIVDDVIDTVDWQHLDQRFTEIVNDSIMSAIDTVLKNTGYARNRRTLK